MARIFVNVTHGPEHPTRAALGFLIAKAALDEDTRSLCSWRKMRPTLAAALVTRAPTQAEVAALNRVLNAS